MTNKIKNEFIIRLLIPTVLMGAGLWYLGSLWNARMRQQNLILIMPVVIAMIPFYLWVIAFEVRRYQRELAAARVASGMNIKQPSQPREHLYFMAIAAFSVVLYYWFGAIPATIATMVAGLLLLGVRSVTQLILVPAGMVAALWIVFVKIFAMRIPLFVLPWS